MKNAYLIMAHTGWEQLKILLKTLDVSNNSIYVHVDKKSETFSTEDFLGLLKNADLHFIDRRPLFWGDVSEIECELRLLSEAVQKPFDYCHLLSGQDLPIKNAKAINLFLKENYGRNFIEFNPDWYDLSGKRTPMHSGRYKVQYYHPFVRSKSYRKRKIIKYADHFVAHCQKWLGLLRHKEWDVYCGSQFFSITYDFAKYLVSQMDTILANYKSTLASSEVFVQTTIMQSPFRDTVFAMDKSYGNLRFIDWSRREGTGPRTFRLEDFEALSKLPDYYLFARKFNLEVDSVIIEKMVDYTKEKS